MAVQAGAGPRGADIVFPSLSVFLSCTLFKSRMLMPESGCSSGACLVLAASGGCGAVGANAGAAGRGGGGGPGGAAAGVAGCVVTPGSASSLSGGGTHTAEAGVLRTAPPRLRRYSDGLIRLSEPEQGNLGGTKGSTWCLLPVGVGGVEADNSSEECSAPTAADLAPVPKRTMEERFAFSFCYWVRGGEGVFRGA